MDEAEPTRANGTDAPESSTPPEIPPGNSAVEIAARKGFGPLSPQATDLWHGDARPCASCGQLVRRDAPSCADCGEDLSEQRLEIMRAHAGPWYVLEHVRPFPGVTFERILRQIRRGVLTATTVIRGPTTDHQWRFAAETPGISKYFGLCWKCQNAVTSLEHACNECGADLGEVTDIAIRNPHSAVGENPELAALRQAARSVPRAPLLEPDRSPSGPTAVAWIVPIIVLVFVAALFAVVQWRDAEQRQPPPAGPQAVISP